MNIIPKFQGGGGFSSFFTVYKNTSSVQPSSGYSRRSNSTSESTTLKDSSKESKSEDNEKGKLTEKDLYTMLKDVDGLPNEMRSLISSFRNTMSIPGLMQTGINGGLSSLGNTYLTSLYKMRVANQNKVLYDAAIQKSKENGSLGEVAITLSGGLLSYGKDGKIQEITVDQYQKNPEQYNLLTNSNLAWLRKYDSKMAFVQNDSSFEIISGGMSFEAFQSLLDKGKSTLGSTSYGEKGIAGKEALDGLQLLQGKSKEEKEQLLKQAAGIIKYDQSQQSNITQIKAAINYLCTILPKRAKVWAAMKVGKGEQESTQALVQQYLLGRLNSNAHYNLSIDSDSKSSKNGPEGTNGMGDVPYNTPMKFLEGLGDTENFVLNSGTTRAIQVKASTMPLTNSQDKQIGVNKTLAEAVSGNYNGVFDIQNATMGGKRIDPSAFGGVICQDGKVSSIDYPCRRNPDGTITPIVDKETIELKQKADQDLKRRGVNVDNPEHRKKYYQAINKVYENYNLPTMLNSKGELASGWQRFAVINVYANSNAIGLGVLEDNPLLKEVTDDTTIDNLISIVKDDDFSKKGLISSMTGNYDRFYRGTLWMPINVNYHAAGTGTSTTGEDVYNTEINQQARDKRDNWNQPPQI